MTQADNKSLLHATDVVLDKLLFERQIGNQSTVTPDTYLQHFKDASADTADYQTDAEIRLDAQTQKVIAATGEIDQILDKSEVQLNSASNSLMLIDAARKLLVTGTNPAGQAALLDAIEMAMSSLTAQLAVSQQEVVNSRTRVHELEVEVSTDHLTKALNRVALDKKLNMLEANKIPFSVIQCDLDFFKVINDTFGHPAGDKVLQVFTDRVQHHLKANDELYRAGGDEFVVILEGTTDPAQVKKVIGRLKAAACSDPILLEGKEVPISSSMGGGTCLWDGPNSAIDRGQAFIAADKMLYKDKESETRAQTRLEMERVSISHTGTAKGFRV